MIETDETIEGAAENPAPVDKTVMADVLKERGALPEPELLKAFVEVLGDLEKAHGEGMLHRDISPARIVLNGDGWKLADYGTARVGTVRYMSPERCQGKPLDERSDIYSLGVVLFQAATGRLPFDAEMKFQIMEAHVGTPPPSPRGINPAVSMELEHVILRALAKDPSGRFQTAAEFRQALEDIPGAPAAAPESPTATAEAPAQAAEFVEEAAPEAAYSEPRRIKPAVILIPMGAAIAIVAGLFVAGVIGVRRVPAVTGMSSDQAEQLLRGKGFRVVADTVDDTLPAGKVAAQVPAPGEKGPRSRVVRLSVSSGEVEMPLVVGLALADASARLAALTLSPARIDSLYSDEYPAGTVVRSGADAGARVEPHAGVGLTVSAGRATCADCGTRREAGAKFCTKCGFKY